MVTWNNSGIIDWTTPGGQDFAFANSATFNNTGTFNINTSNAGSGFTGTGSVVNMTGGTISHGSSVNNDIESGVTFDNDGQVNVTGGSLTISSNGSTDTGDYDVSSGATLIFGGGTRNFASTTAFSGTGSLSFTDGTHTLTDSAYASTLNTTIDGASTIVNFDLSGGLTVADLTFNRGTMQGSGDITVTNTFTMTAGGSTATMGGSGTFITASGVIGTIGGGSLTYNLNRDWNNAGTITFANSGGQDFTIGSGSTLTNTGTFNLSVTNAAADITGAGTFSNSGTVTTVSTGTSTEQQIDVTFNNSGQVILISNDLRLSGDVNDSGTLDVSSGRTLFLATSTNQTFSSSTTFSGTGSVTFESGTQTLTDSTYASTLNTTIDGASTIVNFDLSGGLTVADLTFNRGTMQGSGDITVTNTFTWTATGSTATIVGSGTFTTTSTATGTMSGALTYNLNRDWNNAGTISFANTGGQNFTIGSGSILTNTGTFNLNVTNNSDIIGAGTFSNSGTVTTGGSGVQEIDTMFNNTGTVNVVTTDLNITNTGTDTNGTYVVSSGRTLTLTSGGTRTFDGTKFSGLGTAAFSTGTFTMANSLTFEDIDVTMTQAIGGSGTLNLNASAGNSIGLGAATCGGTCTNTFTTSELGQFTSPTSVVIGGAGDVYATAVTIGDFNTAAVSMLTTAGDITFATDATAFFTALTTISAAAGTVTVPVGSANTIGVGDTTNSCAGSCFFVVSGSRLAGITANNLTIGDTGSGAMTVDNVTLANTASITTLNLVSGSTVNFDDTASSFTNSLAVSAISDITQNVAITVNGSSSFTSTGGDITMSNASNNLGTNLTFSTIGDITAVTTSTLTDLNMTIDHSGGSRTYSITATGLTFSVTDQGSDVEINTVSQSGLNFSFTTSTGNLRVGDLAISTGSGNVTLASTLGAINEANNVGTVNITTTGSISLTGATGVGSTSTLDISDSSNLSVDTNQSIDITSATTLKDLTLVVDPSTTADTYSIVDGGNLTLTLTDSGTDLDIGGVSLTSGNLNFSLTTDSGLVTTSGAMNVGTGDFSITTNGNIANALTISNTITAGSLVLDANGGSSRMSISMPTSASQMVRCRSLRMTR